MTLLLLAAIGAGCSKQQEKQPQPQTSIESKLEPMGEELFNERCRECHKIGDKGGSVGPDLSRIGKKRDAAYLEQVIKAPAAVFPGTVMPPGDSLSAKQIKSLAEYLTAMKY